MTESADFQAIIMAAGKGTRLRSELPKVLHEVLGLPMIGYAVRASLKAGARRVVVVLGHGKEEVEAWLQAELDARGLGDRVHFATQENQLGTAHAVYAAREYFADAPEYSVIVSGDVPNMDAQTLGDFIQRTRASGHPLGLMTAVLDDPSTYGRILRDPDDLVTEIVEYKDATDAQREVQEINAGFYAVKTSFLAGNLPKICEAPPENAQGEYYLTDLIALAAEDGGVYGSIVSDPGTIQGVNTRQDLAAATRFARRRINRRWMEEGVSFIDPDATYIEADVKLGRDVTLYPGVHLRGHTTVADGAVIENGSVIIDTDLGQDVHVKPFCHFQDARVQAKSVLGPYARLRPGADIGEDCRVGNFVEIKKSRLEAGVKAGHLSYLGDAHIGAETNIGAGTITCNYDGENKHRTEIGPGSFIGSNTALIAPLTLGKSAYIGAGSAVTDDVPDESLAVARGRQRNIEGWARDKK